MSFQINGDSKEAVAFGLMHTILYAQGRANHEHVFPRGSTLLHGNGPCSEAEVLSLFARCLRVVEGADPDRTVPEQRAAAEIASLHS
jgi:hypothetical protein